MTRFEKSPLDPVIVSACRTPVGRFRGALSPVRADDLLGIVFAEAVKRAHIDGADVDEAIAGCANQAGEDNRNVARMGVLLAGLPHTVPAVTVNRLCASGLEALVQAARMIKTEEANIVLAGGVENMTRAPFSMAKADVAFPSGNPAMFDTALGWRFPNPKLEAMFPLEAMGETAENIVDEIGISREDQDAFALSSHQKACAAIDAGVFKSEIVSVTIKNKKGDVVVDTDEGPRRDSTFLALAKLQPAFRKGGSVTAGNSSSLNDGAAALVVMRRKDAEARGNEILGVIRGAASAGVSPRTMGLGPVPATEKLLQRLSMKASDLDVVELNEAFAAQSLGVIKKLGLDAARVNVHGGAIALGHPLGCSGARITVSLLNALAIRDAQFGLASLCVGVGQGLSMLVERERG